MDDPASSSSVEELEGQVHGGSVPLSGVRFQQFIVFLSACLTVNIVQAAMGYLWGISRRLCHRTGSKHSAHCAATSSVLSLAPFMDSGEFEKWSPSLRRDDIPLQCQYYDNKRSFSTCVVMFVSIIVVLGGFEAGMVFAIRVRYLLPTNRTG